MICRSCTTGLFALSAAFVAGLLLTAAAHAADTKPVVEVKPPVREVPAAEAAPLPGTAKLEWSGDIAARLLDVADGFLLREIDRSIERRAKFWHRDTSSPAAYQKSIEQNRKRLAHILGVRDPRVTGDAQRLLAIEPPPKGLAPASTWTIRWPAFGDVEGDGMLLYSPDLAAPGNGGSTAHIIVVPDADESPESYSGALPGGSAVARRLGDSQCTVVVPRLINRRITQRQLTNREFLYRSAFEMGRHLIGYEVQQVLALVDQTKRLNTPQHKIGIVGFGEGGLIALCAAALDPRIDVVCVSGYFDSRQNVWREPIYRNVFGLLEQFGDAELASMIVPRTLIVEAAKGPEVVVPPGTGGGPGRLVTPRLDDVRKELDRARQLCAGLDPPPRFTLVASGDGAGLAGSDKALQALLDAVAPGTRLADDPKPVPLAKEDQDTLQRLADARHARLFHQFDRHSQQLLVESPYVRADFMKRLLADNPSVHDDPTGKALAAAREKYVKTAAEYRKVFYNDVVGRFDVKILPPNARTRKAYESPKWTAYEVVLDVFEDVFAYGYLILPKDLKPGERRPVVVCQHGLEGRPTDIMLNDNPAYHDFATRLAERGFVTFAPQNLYLMMDRFRTLQRKANPLGKSLFSIIVPQHQQIVDWLGTLPCVDRKRIGFYGLSYGGKSAMRIPALVTDYCLSICSADFNEWVWKNASSRSPYSYVWTGEYEIFEFDLGSTFNYAEMAALIAPRPFMVERGHFDGVAPDETVGYEYAKVRHTFAAVLGLGDRTEIEWFVGPHTINGKGTYDFLHKHLAWPKPTAK